MIRSLYGKVSNTVIFGRFESEAFEIMDGLKQGCVLSPTMFNLVMTNLDKMIEGKGGIEVAGRPLDGLFYADDIILLANTAESLQEMLNIAATFASNWCLKFNSKKSQIMTIGKKKSEQIWHLGNLDIYETHEYKYLGVIINKQMSDTNHLSYIRKKMKKLENYVRYTLAKHKDINRVNFGDNLWRKAILPSINHASGIWFSSSRKSQEELSSHQYSIAKAILKIHSMPSRVATCGELGWLPITDHMNISRISYYSRLLHLKEDRLAKIVFNELLKSSSVTLPFNYAENIKQILQDNGMDFMYDDKDSLSALKFKNITWMNYTNSFSQQLMDKSSLKYYRMVKENTFISNYLNTKYVPFNGIRLKFKLRTGVAGLGEDMVRQHRGDGLCKHCGEFESMKHFIFQCNKYNVPRKQMQESLALKLDDNVFSAFISNLDFALYCVLGDHGDAFNECFITFVLKAWHLRSE